MSGGRFDYRQESIMFIIDEIEDMVYNTNSTEVDEYGDRLWHHYPENVLAEFKNALTALWVAYFYAQGIDRLVSGDDSEDAFLRRLEEELADLRKEAL